MDTDTAPEIDLSEIHDAIDVEHEEDDIQEQETNIEDTIKLIGPVLEGLFQAATNKADYWLKKKSLRILTSWIIDLQNVASMLQQQLNAAGEVISSQELELEELRQTRHKIWTPGV